MCPATGVPLFLNGIAGLGGPFWVARFDSRFVGEATRAPGSVVLAAMEGSRPLLVEVQALAARAPYGAPQRVTTGFDHKRLALLLAVLEKRAGLPISARRTLPEPVTRLGSLLRSHRATSNWCVRKRFSKFPREYFS